MAYKVVRDFRDLQDDNHTRSFYTANETFPHEGVDVSQERLDEIVNAGFIIENPTQFEKEAIRTLEDNPEDEDATIVIEASSKELDKLLKKDLVKLAETKGLDVKNETKDELISLIKGE